jgi:hypothetical protein
MGGSWYLKDNVPNRPETQVDEERRRAQGEADLAALDSEGRQPLPGASGFHAK